MRTPGCPGPWVTFELATQVFPLPLVREAERALKEVTGLRVIRTKPESTTVALRLEGGLVDQESGYRRFLGYLTEAAIAYWSGQVEARSVSNSAVSPVDVAMTLKRSGQKLRLSLSVDLQVHPAGVTLQALAFLHGKMPVVVESTCPVDRFVISIDLPASTQVGDVIHRITNGFVS